MTNTLRPIPDPIRYKTWISWVKVIVCGFAAVMFLIFAVGFGFGGMKSRGATKAEIVVPLAIAFIFALVALTIALFGLALRLKPFIRFDGDFIEIRRINTRGTGFTHFFPLLIVFDFFEILSKSPKSHVTLVRIPRQTVTAVSVGGLPMALILSVRFSPSIMLDGRPIGQCNFQQVQFAKPIDEVEMILLDYCFGDELYEPAE